MALEGYSPHDEIEKKPLGHQEDIVSSKNPENKLSSSSEGPQTLSESEDRMKKIQELLSKFEKLAQSKGINGFDVFERYIISSSGENQDIFLDTGNIKIFKEKIEKTKNFPVNDFEFLSLFNSQSNIKKLEQKSQEVLVKKEEVDNTNEKIKEQKNKLMAFKKSLKGINLSDTLLIDSLNQLEATEVNTKNADIITDLSEKITARLSQTREIETSILPQAKQNGNYEAVKNSLVSLSPDFAQRIQAWELGEQYPKVENLPLEQQTRVDAALEGKSNEAKKSGNIFTLENEFGQDIQYDMVTGERALKEGEYSLKSQVEDTGDYYTPKLEYTKVLQEEGEIIQVIYKIYNKLREKQVGVDELAEIKATIQSIPEAAKLGIDFTSLSSGEAIQEVLREKLSKSKTTIEEAKNTYQKELDTLKDAHIIAQKEKDTKTKEVLAFLQSIGFTDIPQSITDQIIAMINRNPKTYGFDVAIDLANGSIGMDTVAGESQTLDMQDKVAFVKVINKMLGFPQSDSNAPISIAGLQAGQSPVGDRGKFQSQLAASGILDMTGASTALKNLGKKEQE